MLLGTGDVINNATLDLGLNNTIIGGVYTQNTGSTLALSANSSSNYGQITTTNPAVVNAGSNIYVNVGNIPASTTLTIINTGSAGIGSVPGTITSTDSNVSFSSADSNGDLVPDRKPKYQCFCRVGKQCGFQCSRRGDR